MMDVNSQHCQKDILNKYIFFRAMQNAFRSIRWRQTGHCVVHMLDQVL